MSGYENPPAKRRKLRKGTFSCTECKRRKTRCDFKEPSDVACISCQRHGSACVSQEFGGEIDDADETANTRLNQLEDLVQQLVEQRKPNPLEIPQAQCHGTATHFDGNAAGLGRPNRTAIVTRKGAAQSISTLPSPLLELGQDFRSKCRSMNSYLCSIFPHSTTIRHIAVCGASRFAVLEHPARLEKLEAVNVGQDERDVHPVSHACDLIRIALCLERMDLNAPSNSDVQLQGIDATASRRYIDAARQVTSQDALIKSPAGIEALMLEGSYLTNIGNVKGAWHSFRRALAIAQVLSSTPHNDGSSRSVLKLNQLVQFDRVLSLVLGLPFYVTDDTLPVNDSNQIDGLADTLDRVHLESAERIITRNLRMQRRLNTTSNTNDKYDDIQESRNIELELKRASQDLPLPWWYEPENIADTSDVARLISQMHHYDLIVNLHLPYLICGPYRQMGLLSDESKSRNDDPSYTSSVAIAASRELLSRFCLLYALRKTPKTMSGTVHKVYTASLSILLCHMDGHHSPVNNPLEIQRPGDLKMVNNAIDHVKVIADSSKSQTDNGKIVEILQSLCDLEEEAAHGQYFVARTAEVEDESGMFSVDNESVSLRLRIPYFGTISVVQLDAHRCVRVPPEPGTIPPLRPTASSPTQIFNPVLNGTDDITDESAYFMSDSMVTKPHKGPQSHTEAPGEFEEFFNACIASEL